MKEKAAWKAKELVKEFSVFKVGFNYCYLSNREAKVCALIAVDEILKGVMDDSYRFWTEVKQELEKL